MSERATPEVERALRETVLAQIANDDPPETALTLARLQREGLSEADSIRWISAALLQEMSVMLRDNRPYDHASYVAALDRLPGLIER
jgi:alpha-ketoglutarate-dependent taurine dioxygenase